MFRISIIVSLYFLLFTTGIFAQQYEQGAARLGVIGGVNVGGEEATLKYALYTIHPYGAVSGQYFLFNRIAIAAEAFVGTLAAEFSGRTRFPGYSGQEINAYDTKYYGVVAGFNWSLPTLFGITPFTRFRFGQLKHHTKVMGMRDFVRYLSKDALLYQLGGGFEFTLAETVTLSLGADVKLTDSDELDGLASGARNDGLTVFTLGMIFLLHPGSDDPAPRPITPIGPQSPLKPDTDSKSEAPPLAELDESGQPTSPAWYEGTYEPSRDALIIEQSPKKEEVMLPVERGGKLQLLTSLSLTPLKRFADLEKDPTLLTFTAKQNGRDPMQLRNYIEILRDNSIIFQGSSEVRLTGKEQTYSAAEFLDINEMLIRTRGDAPLARGNYVVRVSTVAWDHAVSSISQTKFLNIDLRPIFGLSADNAKHLISNKAIDAGAEGEDGLIVNFFDPPQRVGVALPTDSLSAREALRITPARLTTYARDQLLAEDVDRSAAEALKLRGLAANNRDASRLSVVLAEIYFSLNEDRVNEEARVILDNVARHLNQHPELTIEVRGYANDRGDPGWNANLASRRAKRVLEHLVRQKTNSWRLSTKESDGTVIPIRPGEDPRTARKAEIVLITK